MDLNSYLTDFFSLLNNSSNMRGGNNNMFGGDAAVDALRAELAKKGLNADSNKDILNHYFQNVPDNVSVGHEPFLIKDGQAGGYNLRGGATKKEEFVDNQVVLTQLMLENADKTKDPQDVHKAAAMASNTLAAVAAVSGCSILNKITSIPIDKIEEQLMINQTDFNITDDQAYACADAITSYLKSQSISKENKVDTFQTIASLVILATKKNITSDQKDKGQTIGSLLILASKKV